MIDFAALSEAIRTSRIPTWEMADQVGADLRELLSPRRLSQLPLSALMRVAMLTGLPLSDLFAEPWAASSAEETGDVATVGGCLAEHPQGLRTEVIAAVLGWDLDRTETAIAALDRALAPTGMRLIRIHARVRIAGRPGRNSAVNQPTLTHSSNGSRPVDLDVACLMWMAAYHRHGLNFAAHQGLSRAYSERLLVHDDNIRLKMADEVTYSLMLTEIEP
jgi:hypothetical protein